MTKRKALAIIFTVTIALFIVTIVTLVAIPKLNIVQNNDKKYDTVIEEYPTTPTIYHYITTTTEIPLERRRSMLLSKCNIQTNFSLDTIPTLNQEILDEEDEATKKYLLCIFQGMGVLDDEGGLTLDATAIKQWIPGTTDEILVVISEKCLNFEGKAPEDYAIDLIKCFLNVGRH